jgi:hypothetical protein
LLRQLGAEAIMLFLIAGALGAAMAAIIIKVLRALAPANIPRLIVRSLASRSAEKLLPLGRVDGPRQRSTPP